MFFDSLFLFKLSNVDDMNVQVASFVQGLSRRGKWAMPEISSLSFHVFVMFSFQLVSVEF